MRLLFLFLCLSLTAGAWAQESYRAVVDISNIQKDRIKVRLYTPDYTGDEAIYIIPKVIPGSYSTKDFGRFISQFKAYNAGGKKLKVKQLDVNRYNISKADQLDYVEYVVEDTWDTSVENYIFQPGGTNIDAGKNVVINHQGFWGYLEGKKMLPYRIEVTKPENFYAATALNVERSAQLDVITAPSYVNLVDNPVLYSVPDTTGFTVGETRVHIAVHSETGMITSSQVAEILTPLAIGLNRFFNGMPVKDYYFLMYFPASGNQEITGKGGFGALEHNYSSFYFLPEMRNSERLRSMVMSVSAHEFLHILTPLNLHSEEIEHFDFIDPKMSQHLWLYEGVTEYLSMLLQWQEKLITEDEFFDEVRDKIRTSSEYRDVSFTEMSRNILAPEYKEDYQNVYYKGALIAFLLDIRLRELSGGEKGLVDLLQELAARYGPSKPFKDEDLIPEIVSLSYPEIGAFFDQYVTGSQPLPIDEYFRKIGFRYFDSRTDSMMTFGNLSLTMDDDPREFIVVNTPKGQNVFGLEDDDVIRMVNGEVVTEENYEQVLQPVISPDGSTVTIVLQRDGETYQAESNPIKVPVNLKFVVEQDPSAESPQINLRESLIR